MPFTRRYLTQGKTEVWNVSLGTWGGQIDDTPDEVLMALDSKFAFQDTVLLKTGEVLRLGMPHWNYGTHITYEDAIHIVSEADIISRWCPNEQRI